MVAINKLLAVATKELQILAKDRGSLFTIFIVPFLVSLIVASPWVGDTDVPILPVILVNPDPGDYGDLIADILLDIEDIEVTVMDSAEAATQLVAEGETLAAVIVPPDFSQRIEAYEPVTVRVLIDPAQAEYATIITSIVEEVIKPVMIQGEISYGMGAVLDKMGVAQREDSQAVQAAEAQKEGVINTQMQKMKNDPKIALQKEDLAGAEVRAPDNLFSVFIPGFTVMFAFFLMPALATELLREKEAGSLRRLLAAPLSRSAIIGGKMLAYLLLVVLQVTLIFGSGNIFFGMPLGRSLLGLLLLTLALGLAATALGMMIAALARSKSQAESISMILIFVLGGIGGSIQMGIHPIYRMKGFMGLLSRLTPHAHALEGYTRLMVEEGGLIDVLPQIGILIGMMALFFSVAVWRFRFD